MSRSIVKAIVLSLMSLGLFIGAYFCLVPILGITGIIGLLLFCMAYKAGTL